MDDDFGVRVGAESVPQRLQFRHQFLEVVDFPVEHHHHRAILIEQRLLAGGEIDNRQAPVAQGHARFQMQSRFVRAAVGLAVIHADQQSPIELAPSFEIKNACYPAHMFTFPLSIISCCPNTRSYTA